MVETIKYTCGDNGGSGVKNCPGGSDHKETGVKDTVKYTVYDNVNNYMTCTVKVTAYKQYKYIKRNVPNTCSKPCCGYKVCRDGGCCGWYYETRANCSKCGDKCELKKYCADVAYYSGSCKQWKWHNVCSGCRTCKYKAAPKQCSKSCCGNRTCTDGGCCGYSCGSSWTGWGASSTGCTSKSRTLYK